MNDPNAPTWVSMLLLPLIRQHTDEDVITITLIQDNAKCHRSKYQEDEEEDADHCCQFGLDGFISDAESLVSEEEDDVDDDSTCCSFGHHCEIDESNNSHSHSLCRWGETCPHSNCCPKLPCRGELSPAMFDTALEMDDDELSGASSSSPALKSSDTCHAHVHHTCTRHSSPPRQASQDKHGHEGCDRHNHHDHHKHHDDAHCEHPSPPQDCPPLQQDHHHQHEKEEETAHPEQASPRKQSSFPSLTRRPSLYKHSNLSPPTSRRNLEQSRLTSKAA